MSSQANGREAVPPARPNQKTFLDEVILTFSSPMAWLLVVALILTWSGVAIVLFDLLDYKTLAGNERRPFVLVWIHDEVSCHTLSKALFTIHLYFFLVMWCSVLPLRLIRPIHSHIVYTSTFHPNIVRHFWSRLQKWTCFNAGHHFQPLVMLEDTPTTSRHAGCVTQMCWKWPTVLKHESTSVLITAEYILRSHHSSPSLQSLKGTSDILSMQTTTTPPQGVMSHFDINI